VYHKNRALEAQRAALAALQQGPSGVMVCTDAAARGLDIADVTHVIQADFSPNAIDFIHRIGRTGRAARAGKVTSLYRWVPACARCQLRRHELAVYARRNAAHRTGPPYLCKRNPPVAPGLWSAL
jgi:superfamily II DNA/RNA helicase